MDHNVNKYIFVITLGILQCSNQRQIWQQYNDFLSKHPQTFGSMDNKVSKHEDLVTKTIYATRNEMMVFYASFVWFGLLEFNVSLSQ